MKRPRSHGEGLDEDVAGEKGISRDWGRRDQDGDRHSPRRRFYSKIEFTGGNRKGSSSSSCDRTPEIEREPLPRSLSRKRFDYEPESFDRRKPGGSSDRYRDVVDRTVQSSSPRVPYSGDRIHRADSFSSSSRRDYPKGFRSERDKPRRDEISSSSSSWRRSSGGKDVSTEDPKSAVPSGRSNRIASDGSGKTISKNSSPGEQNLKETKEICDSSEREEGELEPDTDPPQIEQKSSDDVDPTPNQENASQIIKEEEIAARTESPVDKSEEKEVGKEESIPQEEEEEEDEREEEEAIKIDPSVTAPVLEEEPEKKGEIAEENPGKEENGDQEEEEKSENPHLDSEVKPEVPVEAPLAVKFIAETSDPGKGKGVILDDPMEGPSNRGFDLFTPSRSDKGNNGVFIGKERESSHALEQQLDLSLSLPGVSSSLQRLSQNPRSQIRSRPSSLLSNSDGFTASASFSGSQRTIHNPSCSLSHASLDNFENSVSSRPLFKPVDQIHKDPFFRRPEANGKPPHSISSLLANGRVEVKSEEVRRERNSAPGIVDRVLCKILSDPLESSNRMIQEMTDQSITHLKETISTIIKDHNNQSKISHFRDILLKRSDLNLDSLSKLHPSLLSILLSLKTGLPGFTQRGKKALSSSDLAEIFLNLRCKNIQCLSMLPVDDCDCKICSKNKGFCSACMCLVCREFDSALNTCGWVGCDVCLHWCHTDCALKHSHIRNGERGGERGGEGKEVQFLCVACGHPSEMFGFVKEVFRTCATSWRRDILVRELEFIRRIFGGSEDPKGMRLHAVAAQQLFNLGKNADQGGVVRQILGFLAESESPGNTNTANITPFSPLDHQPKITKTDPVSTPQIPTTSPADDELDGVVKFKRAEAEMYQTRAEDARREAEGLKRIAAAKLGKIEEEFSRRMGRLRLPEVEERRRLKLQQLQSLERAQREFLNLKMRMEADVRELLIKMDAAQRNLGR